MTRWRTQTVRYRRMEEINIGEVEVRDTIKNLKKKKATARARIPNEAINSIFEVVGTELLEPTANNKLSATSTDLWRSIARESNYGSSAEESSVVRTMKYRCRTALTAEPYWHRRTRGCTARGIETTLRKKNTTRGLIQQQRISNKAPKQRKNTTQEQAEQNTEQMENMTELWQKQSRNTATREEIYKRIWRCANRRTLCETWTWWCTRTAEPGAKWDKIIPVKCMKIENLTDKNYATIKLGNEKEIYITKSQVAEQTPSYCNSIG